MKDYIRLSNAKAYQLLNSGAMILISTVSANGKYDIAPIAWQCPIDYDPVTRLLFVCDSDHQTFKNISETRQFGISVPHVSQLILVKEVGSCSGRDNDKFSKFNIQTFQPENINCLFPEDCIGYIECRVYNIITDCSVSLVFGEVLSSKADREAYNMRLLSEAEAGKTIHHLGGKIFISTGDNIIK